MFFTKLMMQSAKAINYDYVEDDSLLFKRENELWGYDSGGNANYKIIKDLNKGEKGVTYCGTLPNVTGAYLLTLIRYRLIVYRYSDGRVAIRNYQSGGWIIGQNAPVDIEQPYIAVTLYFPTETTQTVSLSVEGQEPITATGSWNGTTKDGWVGMSSSNTLKTEPMELGLIYDRVLTDAELEQNYQAFLAKHR